MRKKRPVKLKHGLVPELVRIEMRAKAKEAEVHLNQAKELLAKAKAIVAAIHEAMPGATLEDKIAMAAEVVKGRA